MIFLVFGLWLIILITLLYEPIKGYVDFKKLKGNVGKFEDARLQYYKSTIIDLWFPTIFILLLVAFSPLKLKDIGLSLLKINTTTFGSWVTYIAFGMGILYFTLLLYYLFGYLLSNKFRTKIAQAKQKESIKLEYLQMLPVNNKEKRVWSFVSITAGITEEIIYRGLLIFAFGYLFPNLSMWLILLIASIIFGLGHIYQGLTGVIRTTVIGFLFSLIYIGLGSIIPLILLHFLADYVAKLGDLD